MKMSQSRRGLMFGRQSQRSRNECPPPIRPPWTSEARVASSCTGCGKCMDACPTGIVIPDQKSRPVLDFSRGECTFCGACAQSCEADVFVISAEHPPFTHRVSVAPDCLAHRGVVCESCADSCPEAAIRFRPRIGGPARPEVIADHCTGCGACIAVCPVTAIGIAQAAEVSAHD